MAFDPHAKVRLHSQHPRHGHGYSYVYPAISRRSRGLSIGINLNPDTVCNFNCIYCQVDRSEAPQISTVDLELLARELDDLVGRAVDGSIFDQPGLADAPKALRRFSDIAFSGDGEPTASPSFSQVVQLVADVKSARHLGEVRIVLITNACYLTRSSVLKGLEVLDQNNGEIWAKLDAGTDRYFKTVSRSKFSLRHVMDNIIATARKRPICIQTMLLRYHGRKPASVELAAYIDRLNEIIHAGGQIRQVQLYTVARKPAEACVSALPETELTSISRQVADGTGLAVETYPG